MAHGPYHDLLRRRLNPGHPGLPPKHPCLVLPHLDSDPLPYQPPGLHPLPGGRTSCGEEQKDSGGREGLEGPVPEVRTRVTTGRGERGVPWVDPTPEFGSVYYEEVGDGGRPGRGLESSTVVIGTLEGER